MEGKPQKKVNSDVFYQADDSTESDQIWLDSIKDKMIAECTWFSPEALPFVKAFRDEQAAAKVANEANKLTVSGDSANQCSSNEVESPVLLEVKNKPVDLILQAEDTQRLKGNQECGILSGTQNSIVEETPLIVKDSDQSVSVANSVSGRPIVAKATKGRGRKMLLKGRFYERMKRTDLRKYIILSRIHARAERKQAAMQELDKSVTPSTSTVLQNAAVASTVASMGSHDTAEMESVSQESCDPSKTWDQNIKILNCYSEAVISNTEIEELALTLNPLEADSNCHLSVVVVHKYGKVVTPEQLKMLQQTLEQKHSETVDDDSIDIPPRFGKSPQQIHGGLKLHCVDEYSLNWLKETVDQLPLLCEQYKGPKFTVVPELDMPTFMEKTKQNKKKHSHSGAFKRYKRRQRKELLLAAAVKQDA